MQKLLRSVRWTLVVPGVAVLALVLTWGRKPGDVVLAIDGRKIESQMPDGANLRATKLDRAKLVQAVKCGIPGKAMPAFDKFAYTDGRCYGMKQADLAKLGTTMPDPAATLQAREIEQVADFLFAKVVGKGAMNHAACVEYWGSDVEVCKEFPN